MIFGQGREQEDGEPEKKKASLEEATEERHRLVPHTTGFCHICNRSMLQCLQPLLTVAHSFYVRVFKLHKRN